MAKAASGMHLSRRGFLRTLSVSTAALGTSVLVGTQTGCTRTEPDHGFKFLRPQDVMALSAMIPPIIGLPKASIKQTDIDQCLIEFDQRAAALSTYSQGELTLLFNLFNLAPSRWVLTGSTKPIAKQSEPDITAFLDDWRDSALGVKRMAFISITRLIQITWYSDLSRCQHTGYPGPNAVVVN